MNHDIEKAHAYVDNELSPEERSLFETELTKTPALVSLIFRTKRLKEIIRRNSMKYFDEKFLEQCLETLASQTSQDKTERVVFRLRFAFAAVVLCTIIANGVLHRLSPRPEVDAPMLAQMLNAPPREQVHVSPGYHTSALDWLQDRLRFPIDFPRLQNPQLVVLAVEIVQHSYFRLARFVLTDGEMVCVLILIPRDTTLCGQPTLSREDCFYYAASLGDGVNVVWWKDENCVWALSARAPMERLLQMLPQ
ncbi:MAG: hypothetical protein QXI19_15060 [Candidatus Caldarchaeum sp.]